MIPIRIRAAMAALLLFAVPAAAAAAQPDPDPAWPSHGVTIMPPAGAKEAAQELNGILSNLPSHPSSAMSATQIQTAPANDPPPTPSAVAAALGCLDLSPLRDVRSPIRIVPVAAKAVWTEGNGEAAGWTVKERTGAYTVYLFPLATRALKYVLAHELGHVAADIHSEAVGHSQEAEDAADRWAAIMSGVPAEGLEYARWRLRATERIAGTEQPHNTDEPENCLTTVLPGTGTLWLPKMPPPQVTAGSRSIEKALQDQAQIQSGQTKEWPQHGIILMPSITYDEAASRLLDRRPDSKGYRPFKAMAGSGRVDPSLRPAPPGGAIASALACLDLSPLKNVQRPVRIVPVAGELRDSARGIVAGVAMYFQADEYTIYLFPSAATSPLNLRYVVAHELGHVAAAESGQGWGEEAADRMAASMLHAPAQWSLEEWLIWLNRWGKLGCT